MNNLLYYPGIFVPSEWIKKTILYSDKISSIYPHGVGDVTETEEEKNNLTNMLYLEKAGMYEYKRPEELNKQSHNKISEQFCTIVSGSSLDNLREAHEQGRSHYRIYRSKMNDNTFPFLKENRIAFASTQNNISWNGTFVCMLYLPSNQLYYGN